MVGTVGACQGLMSMAGGGCSAGRMDLERVSERVGERVGERVSERSAHRGSGGREVELERVLCGWPLGREGLCSRVA